jgi:hypothetical protein
MATKKHPFHARVDQGCPDLPTYPTGKNSGVLISRKERLIPNLGNIPVNYGNLATYLGIEKGINSFIGGSY